jgi:hypothetical protein
MKKNNIQFIIVITIFLALTASAFFFLKPEVTGNVVLNPVDTVEEETNTDTTDTEPTDNTPTTQTNTPETQPTTTQTTPTTDLFRNGRRGGGGGSSGGSSSGSSTTPQSDPVVEDKPIDDFIDVLTNSGKTESSVPPPQIPNIA